MSHHLGRYQEALDSYNKAVSIDHSNPQFQKNRDLTQSKTGSSSMAHSLSLHQPSPTNGTAILPNHTKQMVNESFTVQPSFLAYQDQNYTIKYPSNWQGGHGLWEAPDYRTSSNAFLSVQNDVAGWLPRFMKNPLSFISTDSYYSKANLKVVQTSSISVDNNLAKIIVYTYESGSSVFKRMDIGLLDKGHYFYISFLSNVLAYDRYLPVVQRMIDSFHVQ